MNGPEINDALKAVFLRRGATPRGALIRWASSEQGFLTGLANFFDERQQVRPARDYGFLLLKEEWLDAEKAVKRLVATISGATKGGYPFGKFDAPSGIGRRTPDYSSNLSEWCEWWLVARLNSSRGSTHAPSRPAVAHGLPPYGSCDHAVDDWVFGQHQRPTGNARNLGELLIVVPDGRGRISGVRWEGNALSASTSSGGPPEDLELQAVVETEKGRVVLPSVRPAPPAHDWQVPDDAKSGDVFLVHSSGDLMGTARVTPGARVKPEEQALSASEQAAGDLANGENDRVEFKPFIDRGDDKWWEVAKSIVAFANTFGGRLYIGVKNSGEPEGERLLDRVLKESGDREKLTEAYEAYVGEQVRTRVKPTPNFRVLRANHLGQPLFVIQVVSGADKPYSTAMDEVLIRKGASNKRPDPRTELRQLYDSAPGAMPLWAYTSESFSGVPGKW